MAVSNVPLGGTRVYRVVGQGNTVRTWFSIDLGLLSIPLQQPPLEQAMLDVQKKHDGEALLNIRHSIERWLFPGFTVHRLHLKADVVRFDAAPDQPKKP